MNIRNTLLNLLLLVFSVSIALLMGEGIFRIFNNPINYLQPDIAKDGILGFKIAFDSGEHDAWGFRNNTVPDSVKIVAIGDSQTYGVSATEKNSWPALLSNLSGSSVYNMGHGGYGTVQYQHLLKDKALQLNPSIVLLGLYYGNDILDTYQTVYQLDYWKSLRDSNFQKENESESADKANWVAVDASFKKDQRMMPKLRTWFNHNSCLYRYVSFTVGDYFRFYEMKYFYSDTNNIRILEDDENGIYTGLMPKYRFERVNLDRWEVQEGLRLSLDFISEMKDICDRNDISFAVVLIPSKENVYADIISHNDKLKNNKDLIGAIDNENKVDEKVKAFLTQEKITYVDILPALSRECTNKLLFPNNHGDHPNKDGYSIIASTVYQELLEKGLFEKYIL